MQRSAWQADGLGTEQSAPNRMPAYVLAVVMIGVVYGRAGCPPRRATVSPNHACSGGLPSPPKAYIHSQQGLRRTSYIRVNWRPMSLRVCCWIALRAESRPSTRGSSSTETLVLASNSEGGGSDPRWGIPDRSEGRPRH